MNFLNETEWEDFRIIAIWFIFVISMTGSITTLIIKDYCQAAGFGIIFVASLIYLIRDIKQ